MLTLTAEVENVYPQPVRVTKDGKTYGDNFQIQLRGKITDEHGNSRYEHLNLYTPSAESFKELVGETVRIEVAVYARNNRVHYFMRHGSNPQVV